MEICNHTEMVGQLRLPMDIADYAQGPNRQITAQRNVVNASPSLEAQRAVATVSRPAKTRSKAPRNLTGVLLP